MAERLGGDPERDQKRMGVNQWVDTCALTVLRIEELQSTLYQGVL